jgi:hypothetical protein
MWLGIIDKVKRLHTGLSLVLYNFVLIFVAVNLLLAVFFSVKKSLFVQRPTHPYSASRGAAVSILYPDLNADEIERLLRETWSRPYVFEPFTQFKEPPSSGRYVNVNANGFRVGRDQGPWPVSEKNVNVFLFGGSTVFGYGVPDGQTIGSYLQRSLNEGAPGRALRVYNFGRGYYYSTQERILFEMLLASGQVPDLAIFVDGLNEFPSVADEPMFTSRIRAFLAGEVPDRKIERFLGWLPIYRAAVGLAASFPGASAKLPRDQGPNYADPVRRDRVIARYLANKKLIEAAAKAYGVTAVFVWQPVPVYKYNTAYHLFAAGGFADHAYTGFGYPKMAELRRSLGANFLWCADVQEGMEKPLYVDKVHYTAELSATVAACITERLPERGLHKTDR